ncbi:MAG: hypothetical protein L7T82_04485 [SAR324 cluster bacterium]|nr:hypothetical protein [SAR324 cluster bacterium]
MKSNKKAILRMLEKQGDSLSVKQIRGSLGLEKSATAKLKAELLKLIKDGKIAKHGTRYQKSHGITERTGSKEKIKGNREKVKNELVWKKTPERRQRKSSGKTETGYFTRNPKGFGFVTIGGGRSDVFIGEHEQVMPWRVIRLKLRSSVNGVFTANKRVKLSKFLSVHQEKYWHV